MCKHIMGIEYDNDLTYLITISYYVELVVSEGDYTIQLFKYCPVCGHQLQHSDTMEEKYNFL